MPSDGKKILKRFRNLDIDGVERPERPKKRPEPPRAEPERRPTPARAQAPPAPRREPPPPARPPGPPPRPAAMQRETLTVRSAGMTVERVRMDISGRGTPVELPPGTPPGVVTIEMGSAPRQRPQPQPPRHTPPPSPPRRTYTMPPAPATRGGSAPIELTTMAARQLRLMAYQHGMVGAGLRVLTSGPGGPANCDFAFEQTPDADDEVFLSQGIRLIVDRASLRTLRGMRITWDDLAGASGFRVG